MKPQELQELHDLTLQWSKDRGIIPNGKATTQALKLVSEYGELASSMLTSKDIKDDIGDCMVVLTNMIPLMVPSQNLITVMNSLTYSATLYHNLYFLHIEGTRLLGDITDDVIKGNYSEVLMHIGGFTKVLHGLTLKYNTTLKECWTIAYEDIKDRKGFLNKEGTFIKETDPNYNKLKKKVK